MHLFSIRPEQTYVQLKIDIFPNFGKQMFWQGRRVQKQQSNCVCDQKRSGGGFFKPEITCPLQQVLPARVPSLSVLLTESKGPAKRITTTR
jgi:hypothetical protein